MKEETYPIDFVCPWVDGNDPEWQREYYKYAPATEGDKREERFRDWGLMRYWFRGVEKYAPWVNKVYFVTCGHYPDWLNLDAPKLCFVRHDEYIPKKYLPVFNSHPIELWMHRLPGLSEHFVYFNDDIFINSPIKRERFFAKEMPRDMAVETFLRPISLDPFFHFLFNNISLINQHFMKSKVIRKHFFKWFSLKYGNNLFYNIYMTGCREFSCFRSPHTAQPFLKSTFNEVWNKCGDYIEDKGLTKFREISNVSQYLMRYWQLAQGSFMPINVFKDTRHINIKQENMMEIKEALLNKHYKLLCLNDDGGCEYENLSKMMHEYLESKFPQKSSFEL